MENRSAELTTPMQESDPSPSNEAGAVHFERPGIEEISLGCEISAYAPDGNDVPLF